MESNPDTASAEKHSSVSDDTPRCSYLELVLGGAELWNEWITAHPDATPDLADCDFHSSHLETLSFEGFRFPDNTRFINVTFPCKVTFRNARFGDNCTFAGATFKETTVFDGARFQRQAAFSNAEFNSGVSFVSAEFGEGSDFSGATFSGDVQFRHTSFDDHANFDDVAFHTDASFYGVHFFRRSTFVRAQFLAFTDFTDAEFSGVARFTHVLFKVPPSFRAVKGLDYCDIHDVDVRLGSRQGGLSRAIFGEWNNDVKMVPRLRMLRGMAELTHFRDGERDLFLLERQTELGCKWANWNRPMRGGRVTGKTFLDRMQGIGRTLSGTVRLAAESAVLLLYRWSSNCGRSALLPALWLVIMSAVFQWIYRYLYASLTGTAVSQLNGHTLKLLQDFALGSLIPFANTTRPSYLAAVDRLFKHEGVLDIPSAFQNLAMAQGVIDLVLIFLIGVALRNYFYMR